jgi:hypothetical protein
VRRPARAAGLSIRGNGKKEACSFLKKRTKKLLLFGAMAPHERKQLKFFASFFQKRSAFSSLAPQTPSDRRPIKQTIVGIVTYLRQKSVLMTIL